MRDRFLEMIKFAIETLGDLKKCHLYSEAFAEVVLDTPDGKTLTITMTVEEEKTNA